MSPTLSQVSAAFETLSSSSRTAVPDIIAAVVQFC
jgi:hypothetical protein